MKRLCLFLCFSGCCLSLFAQEIKSFKGENGKYGLEKITYKCGFSTRKVIVEPKYDSCYDASSAMPMVKLNGKWGFVNANGKEITPIKYDFCHSFYNDFAAVKLNDKWGYVDTNGKETMLLGNYDDVGYYIKDSHIDDRFDSIDVYIDIEFGTAFIGNLIVVKLNGKYGFIDRNEKIVTPCKYDEIEDYISARYISVRIGEKWGIIDNKDGTELIPVLYDNIDIVDSFFLVYFGEKEDCMIFCKKNGVIDFNGKKVISSKWDAAVPLNNGTSVVEQNEKYGLIENYTEKEIIPIKYDVIKHSKNSRQFIAKLNGKYGFMDKTGKEIIPFQYANMWYLEYPTSAWGEPHYGFLVVKENNKLGLLDTNGKEILPIKYDGINSYSGYIFVDRTEKFGTNTHIVVELDEKRGLVDTAGKEILPIKYDRSIPLTKNLTFVELNDSTFIVRNVTEEIVLSRNGCTPFATPNSLMIVYSNEIIFIDKITSEKLAVVAYDEYCEFSKDYIAIKTASGWWGVFSSATGKEIIPCEYRYSEVVDKLEEILDRK